ncbi:MAG: Mrp/NBP35 family ATP-binding protein [Eubacteriales bacterium]|nr:Mrp/NBP35 family ATP-binding protein [Eubacteriales bacterium]
MSECSHDCSNCSENCSSKNQSKADFLKPMNKYSNIKNVIGIVSGKGGVGKSFVSCMLAEKCAKAGLKVGILDADITGPSVPKSFGITSRAMQDDECLLPTVTEDGVKIMSVNLLLEDVNSPVVWRGPVISGVIEQFWTDVRWGELDYLFVDMPPGTGDVALTVFQSLPIGGIVIVSTPQDLVKMIVSKAYNMAKMMSVPVLGLVENMSYYVCPDCGKKIDIFGKSKIDETAAELGVPVLAKLPVNSEINRLVDEGKISEVNCPELDEFVDALK